MHSHAAGSSYQPPIVQWQACIGLEWWSCVYFSRTDPQSAWPREVAALYTPLGAFKSRISQCGKKCCMGHNFLKLLHENWCYTFRVDKKEPAYISSAGFLLRFFMLYIIFFNETCAIENRIKGANILHPRLLLSVLQESAWDSFSAKYKMNGMEWNYLNCNSLLHLTQRESSYM